MIKKKLHQFINKGFCIINLYNKNEHKYLTNKILKKINKNIKKKEKISSNNLKYYHKNFGTKIHEKIIKSTERYVFLDRKLVKPIMNNKVIQKISNYHWGHSKFQIKWVGSLSKPMKFNTTGFRIARPEKLSKKDVGGEHLDLHYGGKKNTNQKKLFTLWYPIVGMSNKYTLRISPGSHKFKHPLNSISKQKKYISMVLNKKYVKTFKFVRPKLKAGQVIFFHPNLIHGSSKNLGNKTRISSDFRIFNNYYN
tara:strand:+ start:2343 stop:3098 length:756 start_codon:yes stop_codon:yes gene_type:complete